MSVEHGGGSTEDDPLRDTGRHVFAHLYESYAASLFDYCDGLLQDTIAAADAVQDSLVAVDAHIGSVPEPDRLRLSLYLSMGWRAGRAVDKRADRPSIWMKSRRAAARSVRPVLSVALSRLLRSGTGETQ